MSKKHPQNGATFSKSPKKRSRPIMPSPDQEKATLAETVREAAESRSSNKRITKAGGLFPLLFPEKAPKPIRRRV